MSVIKQPGSLLLLGVNHTTAPIDVRGWPTPRASLPTSPVCAKP